MFNIQLSDLTILLLVRENAVPEKKCGHPGDLSPDWCRQEWHFPYPPSPLVVNEYPTCRKPDTACSKKAMITMYQTCSKLSQILSPDLIVVSRNYKRTWAAAILTSLQVVVRTATEPAALGAEQIPKTTPGAANNWCIVRRRLTTLHQSRTTRASWSARTLARSHKTALTFLNPHSCAKHGSRKSNPMGSSSSRFRPSI